jgi:hypothetical protein
MKSFYRNIFLVSGFLFIIGSLSISLFDFNFTYFLLPSYFLFFTIVVLLFLRINSIESIASFFLCFSVNIFWVGISVYFRIFLLDPSQNDSDASFFYEMSIKNISDFSLSEITLFSDGAIAIYLWRYVYKFFTYLGFSNSPTIGIIFNSWLLAISCIIGVNIAKLIKNEKKVLRRFSILFSICPLFWLFGSLHIRDSIVILLLISHLYYSMYFIFKKTTKSFFILYISTIFTTLLIPFLRSEFFFVPILFFLLPIFIQLLVNRNRNSHFFIFSIFLLFVISIFIFNGYINSIFEVFEKSRHGYVEQISETASSTSLGVKIIINQPLLFRVFLGVIYMHIYPIPFWFGLTSGTIYDLYRTFNLFFIWAILPLVLIAIKRINIFNKIQKEALFFLISLYVILLFAISATSLETRHLAIFYICLILVASLVELNEKSIRDLYKKILYSIVLFVTMVHFGWAILKIFL